MEVFFIRQVSQLLKQYKSNIVFEPVEAKVDFAGPTPPELTADTLMA